MKPVIPGSITLPILRSLYRSNRLTPREVIDVIVARTAEHADKNIWITPPDLQWIQPYLDLLSKIDPSSAPLWGIPFAIKDNIDLVNIATTAGCPDYAYVPSESATVVQRLIAAGAIPVGKTNLDQFATGLVGTRSPYGETANALRPELISGGSSSGSAVAVALGLAAFALGTDTAGSGRVPAALNGLVGYKPGLGAWSTKGVVPACASIDCVTVFTHTVADAQLIDQCARGYDDRDPWSRYNQSQTVIGHSPPQKLVLPDGPLEFYGPLAHEYETAWHNAAQQLKTLDDRMIEYHSMELFIQAAELLYQGPWIAERWASLGEYVESREVSVLEVTAEVLRSGARPEYHASDYFRALHSLQALKLQTRKLLSGAVLALPTSGGTWTRDQVRADPIATNTLMGKYTNHCNLLDMAAISVPCGEADTNAPFGVTLFALADQEHLLWETAHALTKHRDTTLVAVCGLHMRGFALEKQMLEYGARFVREAATTANYQLVKLPTTPAKPGLIKQRAGGSSVRLEVWEMPTAAFGSFVTWIPAPLGIGKIDLDDGSYVQGFICEAYASTGAEDITSYGGWRSYLSSAAVQCL